MTPNQQSKNSIILPFRPTNHIQLVESVPLAAEQINKPIIGIREAGIGSVSKRDSFFFSTSKQQVDNEKQTIPLQQMYDNAYLNFPMISAAIDITSEQVVQEIHFEGPNKKELDNWADRINLSIKLLVTAKQMLKNGGQFVEFPTRDEWKFLDPKWITIHRKKTGDVIGYSQEIDSRKIAIWGTTGNKQMDEKFPKKAKFEKIVYFPFNQLPGDKYGTSIIHSVIPSLKLKEQMDKDSQVILRRYSAPLIHVAMGDETHLPSDTDIENTKKDLEDIYSDTEYVTNHLTKFNVLGFQGKGIDTSKVIGNIDKQILAGLQVPEELIPGFTGSEGKGSEVSLRSWGRHVKSIQRQLKSVFEEKIIQGIFGLTKKNKIVFGFAEEREEEIFFDKIRGLVTDGLITPQKGNDLLPPKFAEKLPEPDMNATTMQAARSQAQDQKPFQKGVDAIKDNPNDPSKKQVRPNQRRDKEDLPRESFVLLKDGTKIPSNQIKELRLT